MQYYKDVVSQLEKDNQLAFIHYSCSGFDDSNQYSPRITSIVVYILDSRKLHSFGIHLEAEKQKIPISEIESHYDDLERSVLISFFNLVSRYRNCKWIHWNMESICYGFDALEHRYKVLTNKETENVPADNRVNLSGLIKLRYGKFYVDDPKMPNLFKLNDCLHKDFLSGKQEDTAFKNKEFSKLHRSTTCKVRTFKRVYLDLINNKLKVKRKKIRIDNFYKHPVFWWISLISSVVSIIGFFYGPILAMLLPKAGL